MKTAMRAAKQSFLAEEIAEAGYSTEKFVYFVSGEGEPDIDEYDFEELEEIVRQFKIWLADGGPTLWERLAAHFQKISQEIHETVPVELDITPPDSPKEINPPKIETAPALSKYMTKSDYISRNTPASNFADMGVKYTYQGYNLSQFGITESTEVNITAEEMVKRNLLLPKYLLYTLTTSSLGWVVQRKIDDFLALHAAL